MQLSLPAVEFAAFMGLAVWLVLWQRRTGKRPPSGDDPSTGEGSDDRRQP